ncbi:MAG: serine/threonine protein kinase, partial [Phycisphaerales bacterium]|nr:serine/threonine protein kinase [Phycisphaerales bacterium]
MHEEKLRRPAESPAIEYERRVMHDVIREKMFGPAEDPPRNRIGRYRLERPMGRGGMGEVWAAHDPKLDRAVAIKLVGKHLRGDRERLHRGLEMDARHAARIEHPNVVEIHDVGFYDDELYVVMELVEGGKTVERWLEERARSWREIVELFLEAGAGLAAAHAQGIIHGDFKLANVLVDPQGHARVADFGLARATADRRATVPDGRESLVESWGLGGTPRYMAPEQWARGACDQCTDQYAYCVALYRALFRAWPSEASSRPEARGGAPGRSPADRYGAPRALVRIV